MKKGFFASLLVFSLMILISNHAVAEVGKIRVGNLKIIPGIGLKEVYDDNIYLGNGSNNTTEIEESDWILHLAPSILLDYTMNSRGGLKLGYMGDFAYYNDNDDNDWRNHTGFLKFNYNAPGGLILGIDNTYIDAADPYGTLNNYKLGVPQTKRWSDAFKGKIGYLFSERFKVLGYYNYYKQNYDEDVDYTQDYDDNEFGLGFEMRVMPKTWGFLRYHHGERDYFTHPAGTGSNESNDSDYDWDRVNLGLSWEPKAKLSGELNFGYQWRDYGNAADPAGGRYDNKNTWIASTAVGYQASPTTKLSLRLTRALRESGSSTNEYYEDTGIGIDLKHDLMTKFTLSAGLGYSQNDYNLPLINPREDDKYTANVGLDYKVQDWLKAGVGYQYEKRDSNDIANEYTDNKFTVSLSALY
jgi:hypothetical protein